MALLASTQHRDVAVTIGTWQGIADKYEPPTVKNNAKAHYPGGSQGYRVMTGKVEVGEATLTFTFDPDTDFASLAGFTDAVVQGATLNLVDIVRSPAAGIKGSRKVSGVVSEFTDPESDAGEANALLSVVKFQPFAPPTS